MKFFSLLAGAASVSAAAISARDGQHVDLEPFTKNSFPLLSPEKAAAQASAAKGTEKPNPIPTTAPFGPHAKVKAASSCTNPVVRPEWRQLSSSQMSSYMQALQCLFSKPSKGQRGAQNRYEDLVAIHQQMNPIIHQVGQFLPWHRYMMHALETMLQNECGYTGVIPWWDETKDAGRFHLAPMFTSSYFGSAPVKTSRGQGTCVTNGAFASYKLHIGPGSSDTTHCLSRAVDEGLSRSVTQSFVNSCNSHANYTDMQDCSFFGPHAYGHNAVGAVMSDVMASPGDPTFFLHHGFIDRNWYNWQAAAPSTNLYQIGGYTTQNGNTPTTLDYVLSSMGVIPDTTVRSVMDTAGGYLCYKYSY